MSIPDLTFKFVDRSGHVASRTELADLINKTCQTFGVDEPVADKVSTGFGAWGDSAGSHTIAKLTDEQRAALRMVFLLAREREKELSTESEKPVSQIQISAKLAPRELDCLNWAMHGKTSWETGEIMQLRKKTVDHYLANACKKLRAVNRTHAVAIAIRAGLI